MRQLRSTQVPAHPTTKQRSVTRWPKSQGCVKRLTHLSEIGKLLVAPHPTAAREGGAMEGAMPIINFGAAAC
jgi:hypothetical protein